MSRILHKDILASAKGFGRDPCTEPEMFLWSNKSVWFYSMVSMLSQGLVHWRASLQQGGITLLPGRHSLIASSSLQRIIAINFKLSKGMIKVYFHIAACAACRNMLHRGWGLRSVSSKGHTHLGTQGPCAAHVLSAPCTSAPKSCLRCKTCAATLFKIFNILLAHSCLY